MIQTLEGMVQHLEENVADFQEHALYVEVVAPLKGTLDEFSKLKQMLEECIDIGKAKQNDYIINPDFSPELKQLNEQINVVRKKMEKLRQAVDEDLGTNKPV